MASEAPELRDPLARKSVHRYLAIAFLAACVGTALGTSSAQEQLVPEQSPISVEASPQIFATMCALDAAGFDVDESTLGQMPARLALRADLLNLHGPATEALRKFYRDHALSDSAEILSRYITFALVAGPPPDFGVQGTEESLPPEMIAIDGFQEILANFYREAHLDLRWAKIEPEYEPAVQSYQRSLIHIVTTTDGYLREIIKPSNGRIFTVYVEPLVGARTNFRNYGNHYAIVVGPVSDAPIDAIQHAYLHFMLDPMVLRNQQLVQKKAALLNIAARAPELPVEYQTDFISFADECVIKAVELRLRHLSPAALEAALKDDDVSGFVLVRPLVAQLQVFEKAEPAMSYYFPDLFSGIDVQAEEKRLQTVTFAKGPALAADEHGAGAGSVTSATDRLLAEGDREIAERNATAAAATFQKVLSGDPNNLKAQYGLAVTAVLSGDADQARDLFEKVVSSSDSTKSGSQGSTQSNTAEILSWSHVYLGRIHDLEDERDQAVNEYRAALAVDGAPEAARVAAQNGIDSAYKPPSRGGEGGQQQP